MLRAAVVGPHHCNRPMKFTWLTTRLFSSFVLILISPVIGNGIEGNEDMIWKFCSVRSPSDTKKSRTISCLYTHYLDSTCASTVLTAYWCRQVQSVGPVVARYTSHPAIAAGQLNDNCPCQLRRTDDLMKPVSSLCLVQFPRQQMTN